MDWGPYDIASIMELFQPVAVTITHAWIARPITDVDPQDIVLETEQHVASTLVLHLLNGKKLPLNYERSACTHGSSRNVVEIEGTTGALTWDWLTREGQVTQSIDHDGRVQTSSGSFPDQSLLGPHDKPLHFFLKAVLGEPSPAILGRQALFNFQCLRAIYDVAESGQPITLARDS